MKKSDLFVVAAMYGVCLMFFLMTLDFPGEAQTYPMCLEAGLFTLATIFLIRNLLRARREGFASDFSEIFAGFKPRQFGMVFIACVAYLVLMYVGGFYLSSVLFLIAVMVYLKVKAPHIVITVVALAIIIYLVFSRFLKVPLPVGIWFE